jgi:glycosyltransferase involved in cell wall biosynthesis
MHIAIDIAPLSTEHKTRGIGSYAKNLIEALQKYEKKHSYTFFTRGIKVPKNVDLVHYPYFDPFFLTLPLRKTKRTIVTVHDLIPLVFPDKFPPGIKGLLKWRMQKFSLMGAKRIITDSGQSKVDIHRLAGLSNDRIDVVPLAPAPIFGVISNKKKLEKIRKKYKLPNRFVLYVGDVNWNKNVHGLLDALHRLKFDLVLVGKAFEDKSLVEMRLLNKHIASLRLAKRVKKLGFVPEEDLVAIYNLASVYVQPSFYEGFGLPVLEAMACGCPVVCSYVASLREIGGPAIAVEPNDPENIASGIFRVVAMNTDEREKLIHEELAWVNKFSWKSVATKTVASYEKALA